MHRKTHKKISKASNRQNKIFLSRSSRVLSQKLIKKFFERTFYYRIDAIDNDKILDHVEHGQLGLILKLP